MLLLLVSCIPFFWFPEGYMVTGHDAGYPIAITEAFQNRFYSWNTVDTFGQDTSMNMGVIPIHGIEAGFHALGFSLYTAQKLSFVVWFFGILASMYYFAYSLNKIIDFRYFPLFASLFYGVNFYLLQLWKYGAGTTFSAYIALPLVMSFTLRYFLDNRSPLWWSLTVSLVLFIFNGGAGFSIPLFGGLLVALTLAIPYFSLFTRKASIGQRGIRLAKMIAGFLLFSLPLNAYWLFPFANYVLANYSNEVALHGGTAGLLSWTDSVSKYTSIINLFRLQGFPDWYDTIPPAFAQVITSQPFFIFISLTFATLAYSAMFFAKTLKERILILYFILLSLIGVFFSAGTHPPTGNLFAQFMIHVPGFSIFRSSQYKFIPALYFAFAFLISYALCHLYVRTKLSKRPFLHFGVMIATVATLLLYHYPYFGHELFVWNKPLTTLLRVPDYVFRYGEWSRDNLNDENRVVILPRLNAMWRSEAYTWGYSSLYSLFNLIGLTPFVENTNVENEAQLALTNRLYTEVLHDGPLLAPIATMFQAPHLLLRNDSYHDLSWNKSDNPKRYQSAMDTSKQITKVWEEGQWSVYKVPIAPHGKVYAVDSLALLQGSPGDAVAMLLNGHTQFVQANEAGRSAVSQLPISAVTYSIPCTSCLLDEGQNSPEISTPRILPGSLLYFFKSLREGKGAFDRNDTEAAVINRLGLSLTRAKEATTLIELKRDNLIILDTLERLRESWSFIEKEFKTYNKENINFSLVARIESYATTEKDLLVTTAGNAKERIIQKELADIVVTLDDILSVAGEYRTHWNYRRKYTLPSGISSAELYADVESFPTSQNGSPMLPHTVTVGDRRIPLQPKTENEKVSFGTVDFSGNSSFILEYAPLANLYMNRRLQTVLTPKGNMFCQIGDIAGYDWRQQYKITLRLDTPAPDDTHLYLRRIRSDAEKLREGELIMPDITFNLKTRENKKQQFSFAGESTDQATSLYFCTLKPWSSELLLSDISVEQKLNVPLYLTAASDQPVQKTQMHPVTYTRIDPTKYSVDVRSLQFPAIVVFNENYNKKWKLYEPHDWLPPAFARWTDTWFSRPVADRNHFAVNGYANAWYLATKPSGPLVIEYQSQKFFYQGIVVTVAGIAIISFVMLLRFIIKRNKK